MWLITVSILCRIPSLSNTQIVRHNETFYDQYHLCISIITQTWKQQQVISIKYNTLNFGIFLSRISLDYHNPSFPPFSAFILLHFKLYSILLFSFYCLVGYFVLTICVCV